MIKVWCEYDLGFESHAIDAYNYIFKSMKDAKKFLSTADFDSIGYKNWEEAEKYGDLKIEKVSSNGKKVSNKQSLKTLTALVSDLSNFQKKVSKLKRREQEFLIKNLVQFDLITNKEFVFKNQYFLIQFIYGLTTTSQYILFEKLHLNGIELSCKFYDTVDGKSEYGILDTQLKIDNNFVYPYKLKSGCKYKHFEIKEFISLTN